MFVKSLSWLFQGVTTKVGVGGKKGRTNSAKGGVEIGGQNEQ